MGYSIIRYPFFFMSPMGKGTYGSKVGRPKKSNKKKSSKASKLMALKLSKKK